MKLELRQTLTIRGDYGLESCDTCKEGKKIKPKNYKMPHHARELVLDNRYLICPDCDQFVYNAHEEEYKERADIVIKKRRIKKGYKGDVVITRSYVPPDVI